MHTPTTALAEHHPRAHDVHLLDPLCEFYPGTAVDLGQREVASADVPEPFRQLLVHQADMTSTLESFHGERVGLRVMDQARYDGVLLRRVALVGAASDQPVEFGAIRIRLDLFDASTRERVISGWQPLGAILAEFAVPYVSRPVRFFSLRSDDFINEVLHLGAPTALFGRQNQLLHASGEPLAEVVEILPPCPTPRALLAAGERDPG